MSDRAETPRRRADAERNVTSILDAAVALLADRPDASMSDVAGAAGLARQTVYSHYASRDALLMAVAERALRRSLEAIDAAEPQKGPPAEALDRLIAAWWDNVAGHARVLDALAAAHPDAAALRELHAPILGRLDKLVRRGQRAGAFDRDLPRDWLTGAFLALVHAAADEVAAGRVGEAEGGEALATSVRRVFGAG
jgi:AcrR family transcriptional regulator